MSNTTITMPTTAPAITPTAEPVLPELDPAFGEQLGDDILLHSARTTKVARVKSHGSPAGARAWSMGGNID